MRAQIKQQLPKKGDQTMLQEGTMAPDFTLQAGDVLVSIGSVEEIKNLYDLLRGGE